MRTRNNILIATLALLLASCLSETVFQPNFPAPSGWYVQPPTLEFYYSLDRQKEGVVYFDNQSAWMEDFAWDFGVIHTNGNRATSNEEDPVYQYRENGMYKVRLTGVDTAGVKHEIIKILDVDNCGN